MRVNVRVAFALVCTRQPVFVLTPPPHTHTKRSRRHVYKPLSEPPAGFILIIFSVLFYLQIEDQMGENHVLL